MITTKEIKKRLVDSGIAELIVKDQNSKGWSVRLTVDNCGFDVTWQRLIEVQLLLPSRLKGGKVAFNFDGLKDLGVTKKQLAVVEEIAKHVR